MNLIHSTSSSNVRFFFFFEGGGFPGHKAGEISFLRILFQLYNNKRIDNFWYSAFTPWISPIRPRTLTRARSLIAGVICTTTVRRGLPFYVCNTIAKGLLRIVLFTRYRTTYCIIVLGTAARSNHKITRSVNNNNTIYTA